MAGIPGKSSDGGNELWRLSGLGIEFASTIAVCGFAGWLFDRWRGTQPKGVLVGLIVGILVGGYNLIRQAMAANKREMEKFRRREEASERQERRDE